MTNIIAALIAVTGVFFTMRDNHKLKKEEIRLQVISDLIARWRDFYFSVNQTYSDWLDADSRALIAEEEMKNLKVRIQQGEKLSSSEKFDADKVAEIFEKRRLFGSRIVNFQREVFGISELADQTEVVDLTSALARLGKSVSSVNHYDECGDYPVGFVSTKITNIIKKLEKELDS